MIYVFDFDKTITRSDTLTSFYSLFPHFFLTLLLYRIFCLLHKVRILSNNKLKQVGVFLFLKGVGRDELNTVSLFYSENIKINRNIFNIFLKAQENDIVYISTASLTCYVSQFFRNYKCIVSGSNLTYADNRVLSVINNYGNDKVRALSYLGISNIDVLYTDSFSDSPLMNISNNVYIVKDDSVTKFK